MARRRKTSRAETGRGATPARLLVQGFTREVANAVEATIVARTRDLVAKAASSDRRAEGVPGERWPTLDEHQWTYIRRVLARTGGNKSEAASILGLHRRSLQRLLANARVRSGRKGRKGNARRDLSKPVKSAPAVTGDGTIVLEQLKFAEIERAVLLWALRRSAGDAASAARSLGIASSAFSQRVSRYAREDRRTKGRAGGRA
jgi:DNA-binding NtrC family response regulator